MKFYLGIPKSSYKVELSDQWSEPFLHQCPCLCEITIDLHRKRITGVKKYFSTSKATTIMNIYLITTVL